MEERSSPPVASGLSLAEAATQLGISERTLRERIKRGQVRATREIDRGHAVYRVFLEASEANPPPGELLPPMEAMLPSPVTSASPPAGEPAKLRLKPPRTRSGTTGAVGETDG